MEKVGSDTTSEVLAKQPRPQRRPRHKTGIALSDYGKGIQAVSFYGEIKHMA